MKRRPLEIYDDARIVAERHREKGYEEGAAEERAKIVAWLSKTANMNPQTPEASAFVLLLCKAIEAGEHLK